MEVIDGKSRRFLFYPGSRNDGLLSREEVIGKKLIETFNDHEACLIYCCAYYGPPTPSMDDISPRSLHDMPLDNVTEAHQELIVRGSSSRPSSVRQDGSNRPTSRGRASVDSQKGKSRTRILSQHRGRYKAKDGATSGSSICKLVFKLSLDQIRVDYHNVGRHITASSRIYKKDGTLTLLQCLSRTKIVLSI
eukprot:c4791_g1_i1 orf=365-940(-)